MHINTEAYKRTVTQAERTKEAQSNRFPNTLMETIRNTGTWYYKLTVKQ